MGRGSTPTGAAFPGRTCTSNSGTGVTTPGRRPPRGRTSSTRSRRRCATRVGKGRAQLQLLPAAGSLRADGDADAHRVVDQEPGGFDAAGSVTLQTQRTAYGIVIARAKIHDKPVVYTNLRSTYMHELDSALGFYLLNNPDKIRNPQDFFNAAYQIQYTFNWFLRRRQAHRVLQLGAEPGPRASHRSSVPDLGQLRLERPSPGAADDPGQPYRAADPAERAPPDSRPVLPDELEQQAGAGLQRRRDRAAIRLGLPLATAGQQHQPFTSRSATGR